MKVEMGGIGPLPDLGIELDGMVVITGTNGTGKSTLLRAIYSILGRAVDYSDIVEADIRMNLTNLMFSPITTARSVSTGSKTIWITML